MHVPVVGREKCAKQAGVVSSIENDSVRETPVSYQRRDPQRICKTNKQITMQELKKKKRKKTPTTQNHTESAKSSKYRGKGKD